MRGNGPSFGACCNVTGMADALAELLVEAREAAGLSQAALARAVCISRITIHEA